jgi:diguanylate cyclase (GGDEF)-like protein
MGRSGLPVVTKWLEGRAAWQQWAACLAIAGAVGLAELQTAADVAFTLAYLLPVSLAAWHLGVVGGCTLAVLTTAVAALVDVAVHTPRHPAVLVVNMLVQLVVFTSFALLLASLRRLLQREHELATTDPLTGLRNRRTFFDFAEREIARARRFGGAFSIAYLDIDGFKAINDRLGHRAGDHILVAFAQWLGGSLRTVDCAARIGGDEFALLLPGTGFEGAETVLGKLADRLVDASWNRVVRLRCSIGCLTVEDSTLGAEAVLAKADELMYRAKAGGGGFQHEHLRPGRDELRGRGAAQA